jgi:hypothetical protein
MRHIVLALLSIFASTAIALAQPSTTAPTVRLDVTEKAASPSRYDLNTAQERATDRALAQALRDFAQSQLDPEAWSAQRPAIEWFLRVRGRDYLAGYHLDKRTVEVGYVVHVWLSVWLKEDALRNALLHELARPTTVVVVVGNSGDTTSEQADALRTSLTEALLQSGCRVASAERLAGLRWRKYREALLQGDGTAAEAVALGFLSDLVVRVNLSARPSQNNAGILSALASAQVQAVRPSDGTVAFAHSSPATKGFGRDLVQAVSKAVESLSPDLVAYVTTQTTRVRDAGCRDIHIVGESPLTPEQATDLAATLRASAGVREVAIAADALQCKVEGSALLLAALCDSLPGFRTLSYDAQNVKVSLRP